MIDKLKQRMRDMAETAVVLAKKAEERFDQLKLSDEQRNLRYNICKACDQFNGTTTQCKVCHCVMSVKTYLPNSSCPLKKWVAVVVVVKE